MYESRSAAYICTDTKIRSNSFAISPQGDDGAAAKWSQCSMLTMTRAYRQTQIASLF